VADAGQRILRGFRDVDKQARALDFAAYLKLVSAQTAKIKSAMLDLLEPVAGQRLLDVGCGTGDDVRDLARRVAPTGTVVGVDMSNTMIEVAKEGIFIGTTTAITRHA
jgi:ubiquinone/menaquinone biosynthesis C-methylase UbiE